jgi:UDP-N-acetylmuramate dehydrogenase
MPETFETAEDKTPEGVVLKCAVRAADITTFGLGGELARLYEPQSFSALLRLLEFLHTGGLSFRVLGAGSNLLIADQGIREPVIRLGRAFSAYSLLAGQELPQSAEDCVACAQQNQRISDGEGTVTEVDCLTLAGTPLMSLSRELSAAGLSGLEFAAGIPASLGGAVVMNAGAHGHSLSEIVSRVFLLTPEGRSLCYDKEQLRYSYRKSSLPPGALVIAAQLRLHSAAPEAVRQRRAECLEYRRRTQPLSLPSAGSAFRNPSPEELSRSTISGEQRAAAQLLEQAGCKGVRKGGVAYSEMHANWLVRIDQEGRAAEAEELLELGIARVRAMFGLELRPEILRWTEKSGEQKTVHEE